MEPSADEVDPDSGVTYRHRNHPAHGYTLAPGFRANGGKSVAFLAMALHILGVLYAVTFLRATKAPAPAWIGGLHTLPYRHRDVAIAPSRQWKVCDTIGGKPALASPEVTAAVSHAEKSAIQQFLEISARRSSSRGCGTVDVATQYLTQRLRNIIDGVNNDSLADELDVNRYNSFAHLLDDRQLVDQVVATMRRLHQGNAEMPLFGEPVAVKDNIAVKGVPLTNGSSLLAGYSSSYTARAVELLQRRGAIVIGKTVLDEFGVGSSTRAAVNPYSADRSAGGSSGGSANAVGGCILGMALGTDTGGSVRVPAAYNGCVGYRPSHGIVSRYGLSELAAKFDTVGTCTRSVGDALQLLRAMVEPCSEDAASSHGAEKVAMELAAIPDGQLLDPGDVPLRGLKIASPDLDALVNVGLLDAEVAEFVADMEGSLRRLGAEVVSVSPPPLRQATEAYHLYVAAQMAGNLQRFADGQYHPDAGNLSTKEVVAHLAPDTVKRLQTGVQMLREGHDPEETLGEARKAFVTWLESNGIFTEFPLLLTPVSARLPPLIASGDSADQDPLRVGAPSPS
ncbi:Asp-tRNA(Asn)/Glu-tRNA(Gln) amidotransferase GatCAB subunit A [Babesia caballi]|uniref:Asp-tRNA(Asn)/Glu-tRNA(Gln) amidotransferase GatCAB subunit A n=1 Tax=Babesia caballi TaxID=5871 RepID=A0AAV4LN41_BABCB|nr:Asp-tRNA(Asn)/Glu-tRNA(Gln) amidotransferase GatCAB subunit A [Babesia caballi]